MATVTSRSVFVKTLVRVIVPALCGVTMSLFLKYLYPNELSLPVLIGVFVVIPAGVVLGVYHYLKMCDSREERKIDGIIPVSFLIITVLLFASMGRSGVPIPLTLALIAVAPIALAIAFHVKLKNRKRLRLQEKKPLPGESGEND